jgi:hypothetical protein
VEGGSGERRRGEEVIGVDVEWDGRGDREER